jgi:hypothetical protein
LNRKLLALNLLLVAALVYGGIQFHNWRVAAQAREAAELNRKVATAPPPVLSPLPAPQAVAAASYLDVAQKDLFDPSRDPNVKVEPPPPPPPPKDPPPLPAFHGMMNLGDAEGPIAIMSKAGSSGQEEVHAGGMIGDFKLVAFNMKEITLEWDGQVIHKRVDDASKSADAGRDAAGPPPLAAMPGVAPAPLPAPVMRDLGPGPDNGNTNRPCQVADSSPAGTVSGGYRKVVRPNPFGAACYWEPIK